MSMKLPMGPVGIGSNPESPENQIPPYVGQDNLFGALEMKLSHIDLIRNISPMQWNMEVQPTSNYSLKWPYKSILILGHADLLRDLVVRD